MLNVVNEMDVEVTIEKGLKNYRLFVFVDRVSVFFEADGFY
jgi:hypothetical protein